MNKFDRVYRLIIGKEGQKGVEILPPFNIDFEIRKDTKEEPNQWQVTIYNLAPETREKINKPDLFCVLYAGYAEEEGEILIAAGHIVDSRIDRNETDVKTVLSVADGWVNVRDTAVSLGYGQGIDAHSIIKDIAKQMKLHLVMDAALPNRTWANGFSFYGAAKTALHKVVQGSGLEWSIQNNTLQIIEKGKTTKRTAVVLSSSTGLIGFPEQTQEGAREKAEVKDKKTGDNKKLVSAEQEKAGWRVNALLTPQINPGDLVKLQSKDIQAWMRVEEVGHVGSWQGGDWSTELQLSEVK